MPSLPDPTPFQLLLRFATAATMGIVALGTPTTLALRFADLLLGEAGQGILRDFGFLTAPGPWARVPIRSDRCSPGRRPANAPGP
jgi:hypothetical protein